MGVHIFDDMCVRRLDDLPRHRSEDLGIITGVIDLFIFHQKL